MLKYLKDLHDKNILPNILLYGNNLIGKKTLLEKLLLYIYKTHENIENNTLILNCSLGKGNIKFIRENMKFFANTITHKEINNFKCIILLNADNLTLDAQSALRRSIEIYNHTKFFIVTDNKSKIIKPILSRFSEIYCNEKNMDSIYSSLNKLNNNLTSNFYNKINNIIKEFECKKNILYNDISNNSENNIKLNIQNSIIKLIIEYTSIIFNKGISANNLIDYFKNKNNFKSNYSKFLFFFEIYKKEIRVEEFLILIVLYFYEFNCNIDFSLFNNINDI